MLSSNIPDRIQNIVMRLSAYSKIFDGYRGIDNVVTTHNLKIEDLRVLHSEDIIDHIPDVHEDEIDINQLLAHDLIHHMRLPSITKIIIHSDTALFSDNSDEKRNKWYNTQPTAINEIVDILPAISALKYIKVLSKPFREVILDKSIKVSDLTAYDVMLAMRCLWSDGERNGQGFEIQNYKSGVLTLITDIGTDS